MMDEFLNAVRDAMVNRGWGYASAHAEIHFDPVHLEELRNKGFTTAAVADIVIREADCRQLAIV